MREKNCKSILKNALMGIVLLLPYIITEVIGIEEAIWVTVVRVLYSIGIMWVLTKIMSLLYRVLYSKAIKDPFIYNVPIDCFSRYMIGYFAFVLMGIITWKLYAYPFEYGYFSWEIASYILGCIWFFADMNTNICVYSIQKFSQILQVGIDEYKQMVNEHKYKMQILQYELDSLSEELKIYFPPKFFSDPLKNIKKTVDLSYLNDNLGTIPEFRGRYDGLGGMLWGRYAVWRYEREIAEYLNDKEEEKEWMKKEEEIFALEVGKVQKIQERIRGNETNLKEMRTFVEEEEFKDSGISFEELKKMQEDKDRRYREKKKTYQKDMTYAADQIKNTKQFWKMHKKVNELRRRKQNEK